MRMGSIRILGNCTTIRETADFYADRENYSSRGKA
jgi:hypothetical protein